MNQTSPYELVIKACKDLESLLESNWEAQGRGLHEKLTSVAQRIPRPLQKRIRWIATIRNNLIHDAKFELKNAADFEQTYRQIKSELQDLMAAGSKASEDIKVAGAGKARLDTSKPAFNSRLLLYALLVIIGFSLYSMVGRDKVESKVPVSQRSPKQAPEKKAAKTGGHANLPQAERSMQNLEIGSRQDSLSASPPAVVEDTETPVNASVRQKLQVAKKAKRQAFASIDQDIFEYIHSHMKVELGPPQYKDNGDGTFDVLIKVIWSVDKAPVYRRLNELFHLTRVRGGRLEVDKFSNTNEKQKAPYSYDVFRYLLNYPMHLTVGIEKYQGKITVATGRDCFVSCNGVGVSRYQLQFSNRDNPSRLLFPSFRGQQNPVLIKRVPREVLLADSELRVSLSGGPLKNGGGSTETLLAKKKLQAANVKNRLAQSSGAQSEAVADIKRNFVEYMEKNIKLEMSDPKMNPKPNGKFEVSVQVKWKLQPGAFNQVMKKYFNFHDRGGRLIIKKIENERERQKTPFAGELYQFLVSHVARIQVSIGSQKKYVTIASGRDCFVSCQGWGDSQYQVQYHSGDNPQRILFQYAGETNPVIFRDLGESALAHRVSVKLQWRKPGYPRRNTRPIR